MGELTGKTALITGGAKNIGKAIAQALAIRGADIIINYFHSQKEAQQTKHELEQLGVSVTLIRGSVAQQDQVDRMFDEVQQSHGYLDILVNNAAAGALLPVEELTEEYLDRAWNTNLKGSFWCARRAAPLMEARGGGAIVNVSSLGARIVLANYLASGPAKAAVEELTRYLAVEYAPLNIRVNTASASMLASEVAEAFPRSEELLTVIKDSTPLGRRLGTPAEFADVVAFLASDQSRWVTGESIVVDGGLMLGASMCNPPRIKKVLNPITSSTPTMNTSDVDSAEDAIAVVGMGMVVAGANDPEQYWQMRLAGAELFVEPPADRWSASRFYAEHKATEDKTYQGKGVFVTDFVPTQGTLNNFTAFEKEFTTLWLRHSLIQATEGVVRQPNDQCALIIGYTADGNQHLEEASVLISMLASAENALNTLSLSADQRKKLHSEIDTALRQHYWRGATDPSRFLPSQVGHHVIAGLLPENTEVCMVDTACSSSLYAIDIAIKGLRAGQHDVAICGGALALGPRNSVLFAQLQGLSRRGEIRAFDKSADGVIFAEGAGLVALKRLSRAQADGDQVLGVLKTVGGSSDGKGVAIYAPNPAGQMIAVERALQASGVIPGYVDWIIAHGTGTPAGDLAELTALQTSYQAKHSIPITSNKSLIGHTGWAAGVISLIEAILGLTHKKIPAQFRCPQPLINTTVKNNNIYLPRTTVNWPSKGRPRAAAISGFGFGGTNAHLIVEEHSDTTIPVARNNPSDPDHIVITGWATDLPGLTSAEAVKNWLNNTGPAPQVSFGAAYPAPSFSQLRLPPAVVRSLDRCQLMAVACGHQLREQLGKTWEKYQRTIGVFLGHMGPTRNAMLYANRCYLDDAKMTLATHAELANTGVLPAVLDYLTKDCQSQTERSTEDTFPGLMPNIIPARIAHYFNLNGPTMAIDSGVSSTFTAFEIASRYLQTGEIDVALAGGINGNSLPAYRALLGDLVNPTIELAEGAFIFALTTESLAKAENLPILGRLATNIHDAELMRVNQSGYLGAAGGLAILRALHSKPGNIKITSTGSPASTLGITVPQSALTTTENAPLPARFLRNDEFAPGHPLTVRRYASLLAEVPGDSLFSPIPFLSPHSVILTNQPELITQLALPPDILILSTRQSTRQQPNLHYLPQLTPEAVRSVIGNYTIKHVRVMTDLSTSTPPVEYLSHDSAALIALHDLLFLTLQVCQHTITQLGSSVIGLFLQGVSGSTLHPFAGLFSGLLKVACLEMPDCHIFALFVTTENPQKGVELAEKESAQRRLFPIVVDDHGVRKTVVLREEKLFIPESTPARLTRDSVVLALGGARGITAEILKSIAVSFAPKIYIFGSNQIDKWPQIAMDAGDKEFSDWRKKYMRQRLAEQHGLTPAMIEKELQRAQHARDVRRNLETIRASCGADSVHYIPCDVTDSTAVHAAIAEILTKEKGIDLVINAAGVNHSATIAEKNFEEFRTIRSIKLDCYLNAKNALRHQPPPLWCNFSSLAAATGQRGEADYTSGNDFLASAAGYSTINTHTNEFSIGWTQWGKIGMVVRDKLTKAYYDDVKYYTMIEPDEGVYHFTRELHAPQRTPFFVHMGDTELATFDQLYPGYLTFGDGVRQLGGYLRKIVNWQPQAAEFECIFDLKVDDYLQHHLVRGDPTLPGAFMAEIAAQAASALIPQLQVVGLRDLVFQRFLKVYPRIPAIKKIHAEIVTSSAAEAKVKVCISTDIVGPNGTILAANQPHFVATVLLSRDFSCPPQWTKLRQEPQRETIDPYHVPGAPVELSNEFVTTTNTRLGADQKRARYVPRLRVDHPMWSGFILPAFLLDGLARLSVLQISADGEMPIMAPTLIRAVDIYQPVNDLRLQQSNESIELFSTGTDRASAINASGQSICQLLGIQAALLGHVNERART